MPHHNCGIEYLRAGLSVRPEDHLPPDVQVGIEKRMRFLAKSSPDARIKLLSE